jgi:tRNA pseudouridine38-40 synthase
MPTQSAPHSHNIVLEVAYDGTRFFGWQKTRAGPSIESELEGVLGAILQHPITLEAASRTDRGVHAEGQIVNFPTQKTLNLARLFKSLNQLLPPDIRVFSVREAESSFHPTLSAREKEYHYFLSPGSVMPPLLRHFAWHIPYPLNLDLMEQAAREFLGLHEFRAFTNRRKNFTYKSTTRMVSKVRIKKMDSGLLCIEIRANNFLYKMARNIVGTIVYAGLAKIAPGDIGTIIENKKRERAGITAPAHGLILHKIFY